MYFYLIIVIKGMTVTVLRTIGGVLSLGRGRWEETGESSNSRNGW